eukprot:TRINITY_DN15499_c0_g1::TRINITY_DN15499_c0_g1_i1::g.30454::m.30454 TRINITY_DN15499_c0_g1::TRINITY_DN15499_c0_g1_i1::g.30454  ORF type:complete len:110 (-),score=-18.74,Innate_immun/PF12782.2/3.4 TRINITY_DN15499_c0_g1_i1:29-358(-)
MCGCRDHDDDEIVNPCYVAGCVSSEFEDFRCHFHHYRAAWHPHAHALHYSSRHFHFRRHDCHFPNHWRWKDPHRYFQCFLCRSRREESQCVVWCMCIHLCLAALWCGYV